MASTCVRPACLQLPIATWFEIRVLRVEETAKRIFVCRTGTDDEPIKKPTEDTLENYSWNSDANQIKAEKPLKMSEFHENYLDC